MISAASGLILLARTVATPMHLDTDAAFLET
jgi:hypothetical protein